MQGVSIGPLLEAESQMYVKYVSSAAYHCLLERAGSLLGRWANARVSFGSVQPLMKAVMGIIEQWLLWENMPFLFPLLSHITSQDLFPPHCALVQCSGPWLPEWYWHTSSEINIWIPPPWPTSLVGKTISHVFAWTKHMNPFWKMWSEFLGASC